MGRLQTLKPRVATLDRRVGAQPASDHSRGTSSQRGYTYRWQQYRKAWLREHPLCGDRESGSSSEHSACAAANRVTAATDVDHIERVTGADDRRFWDPTNHQSLCHSCHSTKTQNEGGNGSTAPRSA